MPLNIKQLIEDKSGDRDYFAMVPAMLWPDIKLCSGGSEADAAAAHAQELGISLSVHDRWLYVTLKKICGEKGGQCFMSSRGLARFAGMSAGQLSKSKAKLEQAGLITIVAKKRSVKGWAIDHITVVDIWGQNIGLIKARQRSAHLVNSLEQEKCSSDESKCSPSEQIESKCSPSEQKCSPGETEEEPIEEEPKEEEEPKKKIIDPLLFDLERQTLENNESNYADPAQAGGDDLAASCAYTLFCEMQQQLPTAKERENMIKSLSETLKLASASVEEIEVAFEIMDKDFYYRVGNYNVFQNSFKQDLRTCIARARGQAVQRTEPCHQPESALLSQEALRERQAARPSPPQDDTIGIGIKLQLEVQMDRPTFRRYVQPTGFTCDDGILRVIAPDAFTRDWLENRLGQTIKRALAGVADGPGEVAFEMMPQEVPGAEQ